MATHGTPTRPVGTGYASSAAFTAILGSVIALVPVGAFLLYRQLPFTYDVFRYLLLSELFSDAIAGGIWYPRWIPEMNGGYGYPQFVFYQPGYFYLSHLFAFVGAPVLRCVLTLSAIALAGALGAYRLIRCFVPAPASLFFLLMFQLTPYHFTEIYARGDLSEWMVLQLSPWPLYFLYRLTRTPTGHPARPWLVLGLGIAVATLGYAHPVTYLAFLPALAMMSCALGLSCAPRDRFAFFEAVCLGTLIGVTLSAPYWLTVVIMKPHVNIQAASHDPLAHILSPVAFFWSGADALSQKLGLSFELGPVHFLLALAGVWYGRREPFVLAASAVYLTLVLLMTRAFASFWSLYPFSLLQFPWRLLAVSAIFQLICMLGLAGLTRVAGGKRVVISVALVTVTVAWHADEWTFTPMPGNVLESAEAHKSIAASFPAGSGFLPLDVATPRAGDIRKAAVNMRYALPLSTLSTLDEGEWMPISALHRPLGKPRGESLLELLTGSASIVPMQGNSTFALDYAIEASTTSTLAIGQLYLPGWRATVDGIDVPDRTLRDRVLPGGRMAVTLSPGRHRLRAWYDGPPGGWWRSLVMLVVIGGSTLWLFRNTLASHDSRRP